MNTGRQGSYPLNYSLPGDPRYRPQDRRYSHSALSTSSFLGHKNGLNSGSLSQPMPLGGPGSVLDYGTSQVQHENACHANSQLILTPPQSGDEATSTTTANTSLGPRPFSTTQPILSNSNVSAPEFYNSTSTGPYLPSFNGTSMTSFVEPSLQMSAPLSPPYMTSTSYGPSTFNSGAFTPFQALGRSGMDLTTFNQRSGGVGGWGDTYRTRATFPTTTFPSTSAFPHPSMTSNTPRLEGPDFEEVERKYTLLDHDQQNVVFDINASIPKGFFRVEGKWTCYRRNYFNVSCGVILQHPPTDRPIYLSRYSQMEPIKEFAVSIAAKTAATSSSESEARGLVQHTPKRDKASEGVPGRHCVIPVVTGGFTDGHALTQTGLYATSSHLNLRDPAEPYVTQPNSISGPNHTFERIQFQKATQNNGKRRAAQQYFQIIVKLEVNIARRGDQEEWVLIAMKTSHPMIVRGRSPGHYKDNRRDSQTGMDPDAGAGHGLPEGASNSYTLPQMGHTHTMSMRNSSAMYRNGNYSTPYARHGQHRHETDQSSMSPGSSTTLDSSPTRPGVPHVVYDPRSSPHAECQFERVTLSPIVRKTSSDLMDYHHTGKRQYEDDGNGCTGAFYNPGMNSTFHNPTFDFSATSSSQPLCAST